MMDANAPMNLVMQTDFAIGLVIVAADLHAIHSQIRILETGTIRMLGINLRQRDECTSVIGPAFQLRQPIERGLVFHDWTGADTASPHRPKRGWDVAVSPGTLHQLRRID